jgi:hypothetical protein
MHRIALTFVALLLMPCYAATQEAPSTQPATADAPFTITFESIRLTQTGFMVTVSYINTLPDPLQLTLTYPQENSSFAADNLGNEYTLINATGMARRHTDPNRDITSPVNITEHSIFLLTPPQTKAMASYQFKRVGERATTDKPTSLAISLGLHARSAKGFKTAGHPHQSFSFTATTTDARPQ